MNQRFLKSGSVSPYVFEMRDRKRRSFASWSLFFIWCFVLLLFSLYSFRLLFTVWDYRPRVVPKVYIPAMEVISDEISESPAISIRETVVFPDELLVFLKYPPSTLSFTKGDINCIYLPPNSSQPQLQLSPVSIDDEYDENLQIVRCPLPSRGTIVSLAVKRNGYLTPGPTYRWDSLAYEAIIDRDNSTIVFVKGLNLRSGRVANSSNYRCLYGWDLSTAKFVLWADVVSVAQEIVRCRTPLSILNNPQRFISSSFNDSIKVSVRVIGRETLGSIARVKHRLGPSPSPKQPVRNKQHKMCVCTMLRNQARFLPEWIMYHDRIGVERWFLYDNNSDDDIERVVESLVGSNYNVTRHSWPWIKTQEAGFAHCALKARDSCKWVGFIDVDEFLHLPSNQLLFDVLKRPNEVAELRVPCHSFGPSGLRNPPSLGVMTGYTCRLVHPERHKSIVRPEALNSSLINVVHHFHLKSGFRYENMNKTMLVVNHYKYQVWVVFKDKFYRRVATYVSDWQQDRNVGSKDRAPGLGTKAVEPADWATRFCEVNDTGLRDWVLETFPDPKSGLLPWNTKFLRKPDFNL